jgi:AcrR family transcriptional regulator
MATIARRVGVRPPSLYKHVRDRAALLAAVIEDAAEELGAVLRAAIKATPDAPPADRLASLADAYRSFARRSPRSAALLFSDLGPGTHPPVEAAARAAQPVVDVASTLVGAEAALPAARVLTAFAHGFTSMELAGAFRLGGNVEEAWRLGIVTLARGLAASAAIEGRPRA